MRPRHALSLREGLFYWSWEKESRGVERSGSWPRHPALARARALRRCYSGQQRSTEPFFFEKNNAATLLRYKFNANKFYRHNHIFNIELPLLLSLIISNSDGWHRGTLGMFGCPRCISSESYSTVLCTIVY